MRSFCMLLSATSLIGCVVSTETIPGETGPAGADGVSPFVLQPDGAISYTGGPVGIGTTEPTRLLDVAHETNGHARVGFFNLSNESSSAEILEVAAGGDGHDCAVQLSMFAPGNTETIAGQPGAGLGALTTNCLGSSGLVVGTGDAAADDSPLIFVTDAQPRMQIVGDGRIGVGTSSPEAGFHVANGGTLLVGENDAHDSSTLIVRNENPTHGAGSPILEIEQESSPGPYLFLLARTTSGGLGATPTNKFYVDGDGNAFFDGCVSSENFGPCNSDIRLKKNVLPLDNALSRLLRLRGVTYEWREPAKHGDREGQQMGMIAQEVEEVLPQWVGTDSNGYKTLAYRGFEALTVEGMRELKSENDRLESANKDLQSKVTSLEARLSKLERLVLSVSAPRRQGR